MTAKPSSTQLFLASLVIAIALLPARARAIEVRKMLPPPGGAGGGAEGVQSASSASNPIPPAMRQQLGETVASESDSFLAEESEKKSTAKPYVDLEHAKFIYLPKMKDGKWNVIARLEASEYVASKSDATSKGKPTGKRKVLIFNYRLDGSKWTEVEQPKWEDVPAAGAAKSK